MKINEKNLSMFATAPPIDLDGYLQKRGEVNRSWQRRHFVLKGNLLFYFEKRGDRDPLGLIVIEGCTIELSEDGDPYCFQIVFHGINNRTYFLSAESQTQMEQWMKALTCAGYEYMKLMVSELQRQLDELEGNNVAGPNAAALDNSGTTPRPPPRRQNPFNRPAPAPPASAQRQTQNGATAAVAQPPPPPRGKVSPQSATASTPASSITTSSSAFALSPAAGSTSTNNNNGMVLSASQLLVSTAAAESQRATTPRRPTVTFARMHEHFGAAVRRALAAYWEQSEAPLIAL